MPRDIRCCKQQIAHLFSQSCIRAESEPEAYWRDVGTIDAYWEANVDLTDVVPQLDLLAMHHGYTMTTEPFDDDWIYVEMRRNGTVPQEGQADE